jgi:putative addiction module component (TIGR02574 family)
MATVDEVMQAAMTLTENQRLLVAELLWGSIPSDSPLQLEPSDEAALNQQFLDSWQDYQAGRDTGRSWEDVKQQLLSGLDDDA